METSDQTDQSDSSLHSALRPAVTATFRRVVAIARPYSTAYTMLICLCGLLAGQTVPQPMQYVFALALPLCLAIGVAALNDLAHYEADIRTSRGRDIGKATLVVLGSGGTLATFGLAALAGGRDMLVWVVTSIAVGGGYALLKACPGISNIARGGTTALLVLAAGTMSGITAMTITLAVGVGLLDAAGNIWGDVRDIAVDQRAGTRTIAVVSLPWATWLAIGLHLAATIAFSVALPASLLLTLPLLVASMIIIAVVPRRTIHRDFLILKYLTVGGIGLLLPGRLLAHTLVVFLILLALPSWHAYNRIHRLF